MPPGNSWNLSLTRCGRASVAAVSGSVGGERGGDPAPALSSYSPMLCQGPKPGNRKAATAPALALHHVGALVPRVTALTRKVTTSIAKSLAQIRGQAKDDRCDHDYGTVRPMLASAEPIARFMPPDAVARAARTAAHVSGSRTRWRSRGRPRYAARWLPRRPLRWWVRASLPGYLLPGTLAATRSRPCHLRVGRSPVPRDWRRRLPG